jgi:hypothetical protein
MGATQAGNSDPRGDFRQTVFFAPHLVTDASGRVRQRVKLPDGLTTYRFMAVAEAADDRLGAAETTIWTTLPLMARARDAHGGSVRGDGRGDPPRARKDVRLHASEEARGRPRRVRPIIVTEAR